MRASLCSLLLTLPMVATACHRKPRPAGPPGDCAAVAEALASLDVGSYAAPDARAAAVAKYHDACDDAAITADEARCITAARDGWTAQTCAARMFPELTASHDDGACKQIVDRLRASMLPSLDPALASWATRELDIEETACRDDGWPDAIKACMLGTSAVSASVSVSGCRAELPPPLQRQLQARISAAFLAKP